MPLSPAALPSLLTMGDPAGIGPDLAIEAWRHRQKAGLTPFAFVGDPQVLRDRAAHLGAAVNIEVIGKVADAAAVFAAAVPVLPVPLSGPVTPGLPNPETAAQILAAIDLAVDGVLNREAGAVVTNPINKALLYKAGFAHQGHTDYLGFLSEGRGIKCAPVMMLVCEELRTVPVTIHIPLRNVPGALSARRIVETGRTVADALISSFGIARPRLAVTGLNPHAGEAGALGREEIDVVVPAIETLKTQGFDVTGPHPADAIFQPRLRTTYDAVITMYHDQALIPVKTLAFDDAVNVTLGLPFVRTSPDHGTAYDLAGTGKADPSSLIAALRLAASLGAAKKEAA